MVEFQVPASEIQRLVETEMSLSFHEIHRTLFTVPLSERVFVASGYSHPHLAVSSVIIDLRSQLAIPYLEKLQSV